MRCIIVPYNNIKMILIYTLMISIWHMIPWSALKWNFKNQRNGLYNYVGNWKNYTLPHMLYNANYTCLIAHMMGWRIIMWWWSMRNILVCICLQINIIIFPYGRDTRSWRSKMNSFMLDQLIERIMHPHVWWMKYEVSWGLYIFYHPINLWHP